MKSQIEVIDEIRREQLLGPITGWTILWGNYLVLALFMILAVLASVVKYPSAISATAELKYEGLKEQPYPNKNKEGLILLLSIAEKDRSSIKEGQEVLMNGSFSSNHFNDQKITASISSIEFINHIPQYRATITSDIDDVKFLSTGDKRKARIIIKNTTLLKRILNH